ncbi:olfactory receptor 6N1-like [Denticeps clupeoides]|uniref:olfactory receptor 6N1-like n=1 Tax=Denticeps clupeoides TaxID=299321 RepID=UPI0010A42AE5|nr:olfactory receptor 6N1-like [Denticeps clupeoides]XP_028839407.1 olfactory receptor 6N1-like [Denticeps clupeoides]
MRVYRASFSNTSLIHPAGFYIIGFTTFKFAEIYMFFLGLVYIMTVLFNCFVISIIITDYRLHTPKFVAVANLAVVDLILSTALVPGMLKTFLFKDTFVPFTLCLVQMYFCYSFLALESFSLSLLAFDRLVAICFPLRTNSINTMTSMWCLLAISWLFCCGINIYSIAIMTNLSFCASVKVKSYFCDYSPVYRLACNDYSLQWSVSSGLSMTILFGALSFIVVSYMCILIAVFRMKNVENRRKAITTCTEHLILVAVFYIPVFTLYIIGFFFYSVEPDVRMLGLSLSSCIPPFFNPVVYTLKTKEIRNKAYSLLQKARC